jgi:hypothetical protein
MKAGRFNLSRLAFFLSAASVFVALLLLLSGCSRRHKQGEAILEELNLPGDLSDYLLVDFDGDAKDELLAFCAADESSHKARSGCLFRQVNGKFGPEPVAIFDIPEKAILFDTGDVDGDGAPEITYLTTDGMSYFDVTDGNILPGQQLIAEISVFNLGTAESAIHWDFFREMQRGDRALCVIPTLDGLSLYTVRNGSISYTGNVPIGFRASTMAPRMSEFRNMSPLSYCIDVPSLEFGDYNGDGIDDMFVMYGKDVSIYAGSLQGDYGAEPIARPSEQLWADIDDSDSENNLQVKDINRDGLADLVLSNNRGSISKLVSNVSIHLCKPRGGYDQVPSFSHDISNSAGMAYIHDINNDGRDDMIIPSLKIGITALMKILILKRLDIGLNVFLQNASGGYDSEPSLTTNIAASTDLNSGNISLGSNIAVTGDFNGDNLCDFLIETGQGRLDIYYGTVGTVLSDKVGWSYRIPRPSAILATDCDDDGISEIFAFYGQARTDRDKIRVIRVGQQPGS